jgi:hypothetical protein
LRIVLGSDEKTTLTDAVIADAGFATKPDASEARNIASLELSD